MDRYVTQIYDGLVVGRIRFYEVERRHLRNVSPSQYVVSASEGGILMHTELKPEFPKHFRVLGEGKAFIDDDDVLESLGFYRCLGQTLPITMRVTKKQLFDLLISCPDGYGVLAMVKDPDLPTEILRMGPELDGFIARKTPDTKIAAVVGSVTGIREYTAEFLRQLDELTDVWNDPFRF